MFENFKKVLDIGVKFKTKMLKHGVKAARVECPLCGAKLHGRLSGPKNHFRMWCDGEGCNTRMIE